MSVHNADSQSFFCLYFSVQSVNEATLYNDQVVTSLLNMSLVYESGKHRKNVSLIPSVISLFTVPQISFFPFPLTLLGQCLWLFNHLPVRFPLFGFALLHWYLTYLLYLYSPRQHFCSRFSRSSSVIWCWWMIGQKCECLHTILESCWNMFAMLKHTHVPNNQSLHCTVWSQPAWSEIVPDIWCMVKWNEHVTTHWAGFTELKLPYCTVV